MKMGLKDLFRFLKNIILNLFSPNRDTRNILFFGYSASGKTTMWKLLQNKFRETGYVSTTSIERIDSFDITIEGKTVTVSETFDGSGKNEQTDNFYNKALENFADNDKANIFVYYLVNQRDAERKEKDIKAQMRKLDQTVRNIKYKNKKVNVGLAIIVTNFDESGGIDKSKIPSSILNFRFRNISFRDILTFDIHKEDEIEIIIRHILKGYEQ